MAEVVLIPTGTLEHAALGPSLSRLFPGHEFVARPKERPRDGFTSVDVTRIPSERPPGHHLDELAAELVAAVSPGRKGKPADFAFLIEDSELVNDHQPGLVVQALRDAVDRHIRRTWSGAALSRAFMAVRERCSFHLLRPMIEAYFFGEPAALVRAGAMRSPSHGPDLEGFRTDDADFLAVPNGVHDHLADMPSRRHHPKSYLHHLCDPTLTDRKRRYRETRDGGAALRALDWEMVLRQPPRCPFLHALLDDLSFALD